MTFWTVLTVDYDLPNDGHKTFRATNNHALPNSIPRSSSQERQPAIQTEAAQRSANAAVVHADAPFEAPLDAPLAHAVAHVVALQAGAGHRCRCCRQAGMQVAKDAKLRRAQEWRHRGVGRQRTARLEDCQAAGKGWVRRGLSGCRGASAGNSH